MRGAVQLAADVEPLEPLDEVDDDVAGVLAAFESPLLELEPDEPELSLDPLLLDAAVLDESLDEVDEPDDELEPLRLSVL